MLPARKFAERAISDQKAAFQSWGILGDWDNGCYFTFDKDYVINQLRQFYKLYEKVKFCYLLLSANLVGQGEKFSAWQ